MLHVLIIKVLLYERGEHNLQNNLICITVFSYFATITLCEILLETPLSTVYHTKTYMFTHCNSNSSFRIGLMEFHTNPITE